MKPNFALRLAHDSIELLQRSSDGWLSVGVARLDAADLDTAIGELRDHAERLAPEGVTTKLIIPDTELRYETVAAPGPDDDARRRQIEAAIDGLTPYGLDDLVYDWVVDGDQAHVVIAARETLSEAEDFAAERGLNPVACVALPDEGKFLGEPFFGATRHAANLLPAGTRVLPDTEPVQVVGRARIPAARTVPAAGTPDAAPAAKNGKAPPTPEKAAKPAAPSAPPAASPPASTPAPDVLRKTSVAAPRAPDTVRDQPSKAAEAPKAASSAAQGERPEPPREPATPVADPRKRLGATPSAADSGSRPAVSPGGRPGVLPTGLRRPDKPADASAGASAGAGMGGLMRRLGSRLAGKPAAAGKSAEAAPPAAAAPAEAGKPPADSAAPAFASRRAPSLVSERPAGTAAPGSGGRIALVARGQSATADARAPNTVSRLGDAVRRRLRSSGSKPHGDTPAKPAAAAASATSSAAPPPASDAPKPKKPAAPSAASPAARKSPVPFDRAPARPAPTEPIVSKSRPPSSEQEKAREAQALTIFGARAGSPASAGNGARRGMAIAGGLLLLLIAFGVWAAYFSASTAPERAVAPELAETTSPATEPDEPVSAPPPIAESEPEATTSAPPVAEEDTPATEEPAEALDADGRLEALVEEALRQEQPVGQFADPDLADAGEAAIGTPAETNASPPERLVLPGTLQRPVIEAPATYSLPPPPPFGTEMQLGADGLIVATPEGAMNPEGVTVFTRQPDAVPPTRPEITPPEPAASPEDALQLEDDASAADAVEPAAAEEAALPGFNLELAPTPGADPALAEFRPRPRPVAAATPESGPTVAEPAADDGQAQEELSPGAIALAALRPNPRPESVVERAVAVSPEVAPGTELDLSSATPQAVARSRTPSARPQDFAAAVQRALAAAARERSTASQPQAQPQQQTAAAQPQAQPQPSAAAQPQIPSSASVAETATQRRAINLRRVNLIGVFGAQSNRRALVRMPNGRVVRVQVGDTLDGGRVSAIGDGELRYVRGGRNQVLRIGQSG